MQLLEKRVAELKHDIATLKKKKHLRKKGKEKVFSSF
jgi:hypothetical protein